MSELPGRRRRIRKFNPGAFQPDEELIGQFVVRKHEFSIVLEVLRGNVGAPSCQHVLLVAPRGRGKTMLLARVAAELRTNRALSERLLPVLFMEESQEIFNLGDFWLETLFHLARDVGKTDPETAQELRDTHADLAARWRGEDLEDRARAAALNAADRLGQQLVLMVENLQTLCGDVDEDFGWKLRETLQSDPQIILLATATSRFRGLDDAKEPFFELFRIVRLEPLDTEECRRLWQAISGDTVSGREIRPLQILTGGNPRLLVIVAGFAQHRSLRQLMENLVGLIDDHTEYFRSHLIGFAKTERRVYLSVIDLWQPSSTGEIAARARLDVRSVSTLLGRLVNRGAVAVEGSGKKRLYAATERLYSIYYKLRRERDEAAVVRNLIHFMTAFYSGDELAEMFDMWITEARQFPAIREGIDLAFAEIPRVGILLFGMTRSKKAPPYPMIITDERLIQVARTMATALEEGEFRKVMEIADRYLDSHQSDSSGTSDAVTAFMIFIKAHAHSELGNPKKAVAIYNWVIERFGDHSALDVQSTVGWALCNKGIQQGLLGEVEAGIETYDEIVKRFGDSDVKVFREQVANALIGKGMMRWQLREADAAIALWDEVVERFGDGDTLDLQGMVAEALFNKGAARTLLGETDAAIALYDEVVDRFGDSDAPNLQGPVAQALFNKGAMQGQLGEADAEIALYDEVVERFGDSDASDLQGMVAKALINKGMARGLLGEADAAIALWDEVVERFGDSDAPDLQGMVAKALFHKGVARGLLGEADAAIALYDEVIERFGDSDAPNLQGPVAQALFNKGAMQGQLGEADAEIALYDEVVERLGDSDAPDLQELVAKALTNKGEVQIALHHLEDALRTSETLARKYGVLIDENAVTFEWRAKWMKLKVFFEQRKHSDYMAMLRSIYAALVPENRIMVQQMVAYILTLTSNGVRERDLLDILLGDRRKADALEPLVVALRQRIGETVRAPTEVLEIAQDIRKKIEEME